MNQRTLKEIIVFCEGDASKASTWSNVPYLMTKTFEEKEITVHRVDISPNRYVQAIFNKLLKIFIQKKAYTFVRTPLYRKWVNYIIKKNVLKYSNSEYCLFLNFDFYNYANDIPSFCFSDWTYQMLIEERLIQSLSKYDITVVQNETKVINSATIVCPLFSETSEKLKKQYPNANICSIPQNVINNMSNETLDTDKLIQQKANSCSILFIGREGYLPGLLFLIEAIKILNNKNIHLDVVGMNANVLENVPHFVTFYGYLHKEEPTECRKFYTLLKNAKFVANPSKHWAAYSSIVEAMYFYTPILIGRFNQFIKEFGENIDFGIYADTTTPELLASQIKKMLNMPNVEYHKMSLSAHLRVKDYTWSTYVSEMIKLMEDTITNNKIKQ